MLAIISDIHANLTALQAVIAHARALGCDRFISLGDVVGYGPQPAECIELLANIDASNVMGNHDAYVLGIEDCARSRTVADIAAYHRSLLQPCHVEWLSRSLPMLQEGDCMLVHGSWADPRDGYLYQIGRRDLPADYRGLFSGHTHVQTLLGLGEQFYCNPGSVGQPRDGDPRAAFATWEDAQIQLHRASYDVDAVAALIRSSPIPDAFGDCLRYGSRGNGKVDTVRLVEDEPEVQ